MVEHTAFSVIAAETAAGLAHGDRFAPRLFDLGEVVSAAIDGDQVQLLARGVGRFGLRVERGINLV